MTADPMSAELAAVAVNLLGVVEHPVLGDSPYRVSRDGEPYLPVGDGGIVLGLRARRPGARRWPATMPRPAPAWCTPTRPPGWRWPPTPASATGCRSGPAPAAGAVGAVDRQARRGRPGDRGFRARTTWPGCGRATRSRCGPAGRAGGHRGSRPPVAVMNVDPGLLAALPVRRAAATAVTAGVRLAVPSKLAGNGIGRPAAGWDLDLQLDTDRRRRRPAARRPGRGDRHRCPVEHGLPAGLGDRRAWSCTAAARCPVTGRASRRS